MFFFNFRCFSRNVPTQSTCLANLPSLSTCLSTTQSELLSEDVKLLKFIQNTPRLYIQHAVYYNIMYDVILYYDNISVRYSRCFRSTNIKPTIKIFIILFCLLCASS